MLQNSAGNTDETWIIPINYATASNINFDQLSTDYWLTTTEGNVHVDGLGADDWIILNKKETGKQ